MSLPYKDEVVVFGEFVEHKAEFSEHIHIEEVCFIDECSEHLPWRLRSKAASMRRFSQRTCNAVVVDLECVTEDFEGDGGNSREKEN